MILDSATKLLQIVLGEAKTTNDCDITSNWADQTPCTFVPGNFEVKSNGVTPVTVVGAPANLTARNVQEIRLHNNDTVSHTVTLQLFDGTNTWIVDGPVVVNPNTNYLYTPETLNPIDSAPLNVTDGTNSVSPTTEIYFKNALVTNLGSGEAQVQTTSILNPDGALPDGDGIGVTLRAGDGVGTGNGGSLFGEAGSGQVGGNIYLKGGITNGVTEVQNQVYIGAFKIALQAGYKISSYGYNISIYAGNAAHSSTEHGGSLIFQTGDAAGIGQYGGLLAINLGAASDPTGLPGLLTVNSDPSIMSATLSWLAGQTLNDRTIFTATRPVMITGIIARLDAANGAAATMAVYKAPSGTAFSGGTVLSSTSVDLNGTANDNQTLTLSTTLTDLQLAVGDSLGLVESGALSLSAGCLTVHFTPQ